MRTLCKPAGLPVFPPHADPSGDSLLLRLLAEEPWRSTLAWPDGFAGGLAHRLDNATSGAVCVADDPEELTQIRSWFRDGQLTKTYRMVVARDPSWDDNRCDLPIAHDVRRKGRMIVARGQATPHRGKWLPACTVFFRLSGALFEATLTTGVMHQIRVHAAFVGIPLAGDRHYGGGTPRADAPPEVPFLLHHEGFRGPGKHGTTAVARPAWAEITGNP